jgi:hypothetical protein
MFTAVPVFRLKSWFFISGWWTSKHWTSFDIYGRVLLSAWGEVSVCRTFCRSVDIDGSVYETFLFIKFADGTVLQEQYPVQLSDDADLSHFTFRYATGKRTNIYSGDTSQTLHQNTAHCHYLLQICGTCVFVDFIVIYSYVNCIVFIFSWPPLLCSGQSSWLPIQRSWVWFPALPHFSSEK